MTKTHYTLISSILALSILISCFGCTRVYQADEILQYDCVSETKDFSKFSPEKKDGVLKVLALAFSHKNEELKSKAEYCLTMIDRKPALETLNELIELNSKQIKFDRFAKPIEDDNYYRSRLFGEVRDYVKYQHPNAFEDVIIFADNAASDGYYLTALKSFLILSPYNQSLETYFGGLPESTKARLANENYPKFERYIFSQSEALTTAFDEALISKMELWADKVSEKIKSDIEAEKEANRKARAIQSQEIYQQAYQLALNGMYIEALEKLNAFSWQPEDKEFSLVKDKKNSWLFPAYSQVFKKSYNLAANNNIDEAVALLESYSLTWPDSHPDFKRMEQKLNEWRTIIAKRDFQNLKFRGFLSEEVVSQISSSINFGLQLPSYLPGNWSDWQIDSFSYSGSNSSKGFVLNYRNSNKRIQVHGVTIFGTDNLCQKSQYLTNHLKSSFDYVGVCSNLANFRESRNGALSEDFRKGKIFLDSDLYNSNSFYNVVFQNVPLAEAQKVLASLHNVY